MQLISSIYNFIGVSHVDQWVKRKVLMVVKTYPTPSTKYRETVCTAGITEDGKWIRLYPIKFRDLQDDQKFKKFSWIEVDTIKARDDKRPESYKVNSDSIKIIRHVCSQRGIEERMRMVLPLVKKSLEEIEDDEKSKGFSLGIFKPKQVNDLVITETDRDWTPKQKLYLSQMSIFDNERHKKVLEKIPWEFQFKFTCDDDRCNGHKIIITDWEIYQTYRNFKNRYKDEKIALQYLKDKWLGMFNNPKNDAYFIVGTVHRFKTFIIIGYFICPHTEYKQLSLFES